MIERIAAIIDHAAFDMSRENREQVRWPRDASKRRRIALAKAEKIMELFNQPGDE